MEEHEDGPGIGILVGGCPGSALGYVHVTGERDIFQHDQQVGNSQTGQEGVGWWRHLPTREHRDVETVGHGAEEAHNQADVAMNLKQIRIPAL